MMKSLLSSARIAIGALRANKLRSGLTMLGMIMGGAAVIGMISVGSGATERIEDQISSIGSNLIIVLPGSITASGIRLGTGNAVTLSIDDARAIAAECPAVAETAPVVRGGAQVVYGNSNWATVIQGTTPEYLDIRDLPVIAGTAFTRQDVEAATKVALLGKTVKGNLFGMENPIGKVIRIKKVPFTVVGLLEPKGQSPTGQDQDDLIVIPITTAKKKVLGGTQANANSVGAMVIQARGPDLMKDAEDQARTLLRLRHHLVPNQDDDFSVRNLEELFKAQESSARVMSILLASIASVS